MNRIALLGVAGLALTLLPGEAPAGCHPVAIRHHRAAVVFKPIYTPYGYQYQVGAGLQLRAAIEVAKEELRAEIRAGQQQAAPTPQTLPLTAEVDPWANTKNGCASCHTTDAAAMAKIDMTNFSTLTCEQKILAIRRMMEGKMPPPGKGKQLTEYELGQIIGEISGAENVGQP